MSKPTDVKKPSVVVAIGAPQVPALPKSPSLWKEFRRLMEDADEICGRYDELSKLQADLSNRKAGEPPPDPRAAQLTDADKRKIARCRQRLHDIDREDYYEEGDEDDEKPILKIEIISQRLALMLGAVHIGGPQTPEAFLKMLLEHVYDAEVSYFTLESGCRQIERDEKYVQAISEVLQVLAENAKRWSERKTALREIERKSNYLQETIRKVQAKYLSEQAVERLNEAKRLLSVRASSLKQDEDQIIKAQERARQAYQDAETIMNLLVKDRQRYDEAKAAVEAAEKAAEEATVIAGQA